MRSGCNRRQSLSPDSLLCAIPHRHPRPPHLFSAIEICVNHTGALTRGANPTMKNNDDAAQRKAGDVNVRAPWREVLDAIPAAAYTCDSKGLITYYNSFAERLWGRVPKLRDARDRYCASHRMYLSDGTPIRHEQCWLARALREGRPYVGQEIVVERGDGSRVIGEAYAFPLRDDQNQIVGAVNLVADITAGDAGAAGATGHRPFVPKNATLCMISIAAAVLTTMKWGASALA
jgi:PAS domain S-box-containing protein